jgi:hypothetical protein
LIPLADVAPSSNIIGRHVSISSPTGSDHLKLIAAEITDAGVQHAVAVNHTKTLDITATGQSLYHADMRAALAGINPFTWAGDRVTHFTDLLFWNNGTSSIVFNGDDYVTIAIIYAGRQRARGMYSETLYCRETELPNVFATIAKKTSNRYQKHY